MNQNTYALFQEANAMYQVGSYQACLALLNDCLLLHPECSQLLNNRGVTHAHLHHIPDAIEDLQKCISINHLNYMAYFNLFSLFSLGNNKETAFENLCYSLSSIHTIYCKDSRQMWSTNRAIQFSFNNKQALVLKAMLHLQKKQYEECYDLIQNALEYEEREDMKEELMGLCETAKKMGNLDITEPHSKLIGGGRFQLRTLLHLPQSQEYYQTIDLMLREFNQIYNKLQQKCSREKQTMNTSQTLSLNLSQQNFFSYIKEDKQSNLRTAHTSLLMNDSEFMPDGERSSCKTNKDSYNMLDRSSYNSIIPQQSSSVSDQVTSNISTPAKNKTKTMIHFTVHYAQVEKAPPNQMYTVIQYNGKDYQLYRSPLSKLQNAAYQWNDTSQPFELSPSPAPLAIKVYHKEYTCFEDRLIGVGELRVDRLGLANIPLYMGSLLRGNILVGISMYE